MKWNSTATRGGHFTVYNLHKIVAYLQKRCDFQIRMKRKYLFTIKKLRKERQELKEQLRASDELASKLVANSNPKV